jgi:RimJ/RimL family protein N-acetyltransferase
MWSDVALSGEQFHLRAPRLDDADAVVEAADEGRSSYGFTWVPETKEAATAYIAGQLAELAHGQSVPFVVIESTSDRIIGATRFLDLDWLEDHHRSGLRIDRAEEPPRAVEIGGTWYAASAQRTRANTEAKLLLLTHAFEIWKVERVSFKTDARNDRSRTAILRLGAIFEGVRRAHMRGADGLIRDSAYFSILAGEWSDVRDRLIARSLR